MSNLPFLTHLVLDIWVPEGTQADGGDVDLALTLPHILLEWTFSVQNSSLRDLQTPLGQASAAEMQASLFHQLYTLILLSLKLQAAQLSPSGAFGPSKTYFFPSWVPLH